MISEKQFQAQVIELAELTGWLVYHTYDSRRSQAGFPDLVMIRAPRIIFAELKSADGKIRLEQQMWLDELRKCAGVETYLWRPDDSDQIEWTLKGS